MEYVLKQIEVFLKLSTPLSNEYNLFEGTGRSGTGRSGMGDPSEHIRAGKILKLDKGRYAAIRLEKHLLERAEPAYNEAIEVLKTVRPSP